MKKIISLLIAYMIGQVLWLLPVPNGLQPAAWHLFSLFVATIIGIMLRPFPMGVMAIFSLTIAIITQTLSMSDALSGFSNEIVWLVVFAFFISRGFLVTGLGNRFAYKIMSIFGKHSLGIGYGLVLTDLVLAPTIPSVTARIGGVVYPILKSVIDLFTGRAQDPKLGAFLTQTTLQAAMITSAMFLTAMAGNPFVAELAKQNGVTITWMNWMTAAIVPGLLSLLVVPYLIFRLVAPPTRATPHAREMARERLKKIGPMKMGEKIMFGTFILLIVLWILEVNATLVAMIGLSILLVTKILQWKDVIQETSAWDTFLWFAILLTFATFLNKLGFITWFSKEVIQYVQGFSWHWGFLLISLLYFYSHYLFVSCVAHIGAMFTAFFVIATALGTPPFVAALTLGFFSNLMGGLTHYGTGPAPILFEMGTMSLGQWWKIGFIASVANVIIWLGIGALWWKLIGVY
ncbi:MAG TPA: DASS family sodium-coupled anion symporter [Chlamydiales bacterium]|nr:DASS family sodium-coupled anion symporter [Chlamydiales bacterium]